MLWKIRFKYWFAIFKREFVCVCVCVWGYRYKMGLGYMAVVVVNVRERIDDVE